MIISIIRNLILIILCILTGVLAIVSPIGLASVLILLVLGIAIIISPISVLAIMLILAPLRTLIATEAAINLPLDIGQFTFITFAIFWWLHRTIRKQSAIDLPISPLIISISAFTIAAGITAFSASSLSFWLTEWLKWLTILVVIVLVVDLGQKRRWELVIALLVSAGVGNAIIGLYIFFGGSGADHLLINGRFFRAFGTFGQPNPFGGFLGLLLPVAIMISYAYLLRIWNEWHQQKNFRAIHLALFSYYALSAFIMLAGLIASWSRGAWLGFIVSIATMAFCLPRKLWQSITFSSIAIIIIGILWFSGIVPDSIQQRVLSSTEELFSFSDVRGVDITDVNYAIVERLAHWQAAINMLRDNPWLGVGFGNYEVAYEQYRLVNWKFPLGHAHNYYLNVLGEAGMIGFLFYVTMWISIVWTTWRTRSHPDLLVRCICIGFMGSWAYLSFHSLLDNLYVNNLFLHLGVMFGLLTLFNQQLTNNTLWGFRVSNNKH